MVDDKEHIISRDDSADLIYFNMRKSAAFAAPRVLFFNIYRNSALPLYTYTRPKSRNTYQQSKPKNREGQQHRLTRESAL